MFAEMYHYDTKDQLEKLHTRQLMKLRTLTFKTTTCGCSNGHCGDEFLDKDGREYNQRQAALRGRVNEILTTRPHIPNKVEGKALRRAAAKKGK